MNRYLRSAILSIVMLADFMLRTVGLALGEAPYLRIEPGVHYAGITRLSVDKEQQYLVSSSKDKTARLWDLNSKKLIRVFRPPIGAGVEGLLYAVAIAPDASVVATGGISRKVYLFDRASGRLLRALDQASSVLHLEYSPDGKFLNVSLAGNKGFVVYETSGYVPVATAADIGNSTHYISMDLHRHIVAASDDGFVRLYEFREHANRPLMLLNKRHFAEGIPRSTVFSSDGHTLAVAFAKLGLVELLSVPNLATVHQPDVGGCSQHRGQSSIVTLAWANNDTTLYGGGACQKSRGRTLIRAWASAGRGDYEDYRVSEDSIEHMLPLKNGSIAFTSNDPLIGILYPNGSLELLTDAVIPDYRGMGSGFLLNDSGTIVEVSLDRGREFVRFAVLERRLMSSKLFNFGEPTLYPPTRSGTSSGIFSLFGKEDESSITDWENTPSPKLNGKVLELDPNDISRSLAFAPSADRFVLGTESSLQCYDRDGKKVWKTAVPGPSWNVSITRNGMLVVAALGDGTIRWYRLQDGVEIVALVLHRNRTSWVIWTPKGYFDAEHGAESLVGWHVNQGKDREGLYLPISRFFDEFYRPDIIDRVFERVSSERKMTVEENQQGPAAILMAHRMPPSIAIQNFPSESEDEQVQLDIEATNEGGGIDEIRVYANGKVINEKTRGIQALGMVQTDKSLKKRVTVDLLPGDNWIRAVAYSLDRVEGPEAEVVVHHRGVKKESVLHLIAVGINEYQNSELNLDFAKLDAEGILSHFRSSSPNIFKAIRYHTVFDHQATKEGILRTLRSIEMTAADEVILFLGGHGETDGTSWYFIPYELAYPEKPEELRDKGLSSRELQEEIVRMGATKILVLLDSCKSGAALSAFSTRGVEDRKALAQLVRASGAHVVAASTKDQEASEAKQLGHGIFTYTLLQGMRGGADGSPKDGVIMVRELLSYVESQLPTVSQKYKAKAQYPVAYSMGNDFPISTVP
jgi:WD40 repeat protein